MEKLFTLINNNNNYNNNDNNNNNCIKWLLSYPGTAVCWQYGKQLKAPLPLSCKELGKHWNEASLALCRCRCKTKKLSFLLTLWTIFLKIFRVVSNVRSNALESRFLCCEHWYRLHWNATTFISARNAFSNTTIRVKNMLEPRKYLWLFGLLLKI